MDRFKSATTARLRSRLKVRRSPMLTDVSEFLRHFAFVTTHALARVVYLRPRQSVEAMDVGV